MLGIWLIVVVVFGVMVLISLEGKGVAVSPRKILGPGFLGRSVSVHVSAPDVLVRK